MNAQDGTLQNVTGLRFRLGRNSCGLQVTSSEPGVGFVVRTSLRSDLRSSTLCTFSGGPRAKLAGADCAGQSPITRPAYIRRAGRPLASSNSTRNLPRSSTVQRSAHRAESAKRQYTSVVSPWRPGPLPRPVADLLERFGLFRDRHFDREALDARSPEESVNAARLLEHVRRIGRLGNWAAVAQD